MVQLILSSPKGNQGHRYFPYVGFLGLTPIRVEGIVRTKLDSDSKLLPARSLTISVRCYESRIGRVNVLQSNVLVDLTQVLWSKQDDLEYEQVGVMEFPFRISIPPKVAGFSTAVFVDYRCTWRVEAVLSHVPITGVGSRQIRHFELPLIRYDLPLYRHIPENREILLDQYTNKPRAPRLRYALIPPSYPIGPLDLVSIPLHMQPVDLNVSIRSASVVIERRIQLHDLSSVIPMSSPQPSSKSYAPLSPPTPFPSSASSSSISSQATTPSHGPYSSHQASSSSSSSLHPSDSPVQSQQETAFTQTDALVSTSSLSSSNPTITPDTVFPSTATFATSATETTPLISQPTAVTPTSPTAAKVVINTIVETETENFTRDARGIWSKMLTLQWPASKTHSRWAIGETIFSDLVSVKYFVRVKITVSSPSGSETIELAEREVLIVSTNESERQLALSKYAELTETMLPDSVPRSKSKSPRRTKAENNIKDDLIPPSPAPYASSSSGGGSPSQNSHGHGQTSSGKVKSTVRRPHTSAGPRDKSNIGGSRSGTKDPHRKRRSEAGWGDVTGGMSIPAGSSGAKPQVNFRDFNALWGPPAADGSVAASTFKQGRSSSSGKLSSSSFWSTTTPFVPSTSSSSKGVNNASSTSTTASSSSVSSSGGNGSGLGLGAGRLGKGKGRGSGGECRDDAGKGKEEGKTRKEQEQLSGEDEDEERRRRYYQQHVYQQYQRQQQQGSSSPSSSSTAAQGHGSMPVPIPIPAPISPLSPQSRTYSSSSTSSTSYSPHSGSNSNFHLPPPPPPKNQNPIFHSTSHQQNHSHHHHVREWEEELARIEAQSRKSSDLLGFGKRKRSVGHGVVGGGGGGRGGGGGGGEGESSSS